MTKQGSNRDKGSIERSGKRNGTGGSVTGAGSTNVPKDVIQSRVRVQGLEDELTQRVTLGKESRTPRTRVNVK